MFFAANFLANTEKKRKSTAGEDVMFPVHLELSTIYIYDYASNHGASSEPIATVFVHTSRLHLWCTDLHFPRNGLGSGVHGFAAAAAAWEDDIKDATNKQLTDYFPLMLHILWHVT